MIIIGVDPDSKAHGIAVYADGKLTSLSCLCLPDFIQLIESYLHHVLEIHIEDVCGMNAVFGQRQKGNKASIQQSMARRLGMCQQSQTELERFVSRYDIKIVKHRISKTWKKNKDQFEKATGWKGQSNEDTRSAAYFGWLGVNTINKS